MKMAVGWKKQTTKIVSALIILHPLSGAFGVLLTSNWADSARSNARYRLLTCRPGL